MHWVLESGISDLGYQWLIKILARQQIEHTFVKVVPGENLLIAPDFDTFAKEPSLADNIDITAERIMPFGTMGLSRIANERGWTPGAIFNDEFTFEKWSQGFGLDNLLNGDSVMHRFGEPLPESTPPVFFARPCEDNKAFAGRVFSHAQFEAWQAKICEDHHPDNKLNKDTMITIAPCKQIHQEVRVFVVGGKVITGSHYKIGAKVIYRETAINDPALDYAQAMADIYQPAEAFVVDVALTDDGYRVIEINGINSVGLYHADVDKLVQALMQHYA